MTLEEQLYRRLKEAPLSAALTRYNGAPAIFERQAPSDKDAGWGKALQYPRMDYVTDRQEDAERRVSGSVVFNVWCLASTEARPEDIEPGLRDLLDGAIFHPTTEPVVALRWSRSDLFEAGEGDGLVIGATVVFDLLAFPVQETFEPDPVATLKAYTVALFPDLQVDPASWSPTDITPAVYWRFQQSRIEERDHSVTWYEVILHGHVLAPDPASRLPWVRRITEGIGHNRYLAMSDGSPMEIRGIAWDNQADPYRTGQIRLTARFGVLIPRETGTPIQHINYEL